MDSFQYETAEKRISHAILGPVINVLKQIDLWSLLKPPNSKEKRKIEKGIVDVSICFLVPFYWNTDAFHVKDVGWNQLSKTLSFCPALEEEEVDKREK